MYDYNCPWKIVIPELNVPYWITYPGVMLGMYSITGMGVIRNVKTNHIMSQYVNKNYLRCGLLDTNGKAYPFSVHRLVAWEFVLENRDFNLTVNHKDGNRFNNNPYNLEWITRGENTEHAWRTGLVPEHANQGEKHGLSKLTDEEVHFICKLLEDPRIRYEEILELLDYKISAVTLLKICKGRAWTHISQYYDIKPRLQDCQYSGMAKLTDETVHRICKLLEDPKNTYEEIANEIGNIVAPATIKNIALGDTWRRISSQYNIPHRERVYNRK